MSDLEFVDGMIIKAPRPGAPDFVKASISIKRVELIAWLQTREDEWVNVDVKAAQSGRWYCAVSTWKPKGDLRAPDMGSTIVHQSAPKPKPAEVGFEDDKIPF